MNTVLAYSIIGMCLGALYPVFADGFDQPIRIFNGLSIGLVGGFAVALLEEYVFNWESRKLSFRVIVLLKTLSYLSLMVILTVTIKGINESIYYGESFTDYIQGASFQNFLYHEDFNIIVLYSLICIAIIVFTRELSRKMGHMLLFHFLTGKYFKPREEERIFMFLDLKSSTTIAEKLGDIKYYYFLKDFFHDISKCIVSTRGEIYRYVGDEVVVTWSMKIGLNHGNWIKTYFNIKDEIGRFDEKYQSKYNLVPKFTTSFHCGKVIRGEIGDVKSQIVFHGEPLYTGAMVEKQCGLLEKEILATSDLINATSLPKLYSVEQVGQLKASHELALYTIAKIDSSLSNPE